MNDKYIPLSKEQEARVQELRDAAAVLHLTGHHELADEYEVKALVKKNLYKLQNAKGGA